MNSNLVSIILPVYNVEKYLRRCLDSIIEQSYKNIEIICVNDGSTDSSLQICMEYQKLDSRIRIVSQKNQGLSEARNTGIKNAKGEFIAFIDSDDWIDKRYVELLLNACLENNVLLSFCGIYLYYGNGKVVEVKDVPCLPDCKLIPNKLNDEYQNTAWRKLYHRSLLENVSFPKGLLHEDIGFWFGIMSEYERIATVNEPLYYYRKNNLSSITLSNIVQKRRCFDGLRSFEYGLGFIMKCPDVLYVKKLINAFVSTYNKFPFLLNDEDWLKEQHEFLAEITKYEKLLTIKNKMALSRLYYPDFIKLNKHFQRLFSGKIKDIPREIISTVSYLFRLIYVLSKEMLCRK